MHRLRISATRKIEIINQSLAVYNEMKDHLETCTLCDDENGICPVGQEIHNRMEEAKERLRRIGFDQ